MTFTCLYCDADIKVNDPFALRETVTCPACQQVLSVEMDEEADGPVIRLYTAAPDYNLYPPQGGGGQS